MKFEEALAAMRNGKKAKRPRYVDPITMVYGRLRRCGLGDFYVSPTDIEADDWEVIREPKEIPVDLNVFVSAKYESARDIIDCATIFRVDPTNGKPAGCNKYRLVGKLVEVLEE